LHNFTRCAVALKPRAEDHAPACQLEEHMTTNQLIATLFCAAVLTTGAQAETFVIQADKGGHEATVTIPVGAVT
jgi:hypothetical protein